MNHNAPKTTDFVHFDWAIKTILRDKADFSVLEGFLSELMRRDIKISELLESESNTPDRFSKFNRVDLKARTAEGEIIIIEVQQARQCDYLQRITFGAATGITEQLSIGRPYGNIRKVTCISIIYFDICPGGDYIYHGQGLLCGLHTGAPLIVDNDHLHPWEKPQKECHKVFPEYYLLCVNNFDATTGRHAPQGIDQWMAYLRDGRIARQPTARGLAKARKRLRYCNLKRNERLAYDKHLRILQAWQEAVEEHTLQALRGERERIANSLRCSGIDDKLICTIVNPPELSNSKILITQS